MRENSDSEVRNSSFSSSVMSCQKQSETRSPFVINKKKLLIEYSFTLPLVVTWCVSLIQTYVFVLNLS